MGRCHRQLEDPLPAIQKFHQRHYKHPSERLLRPSIRKPDWFAVQFVRSAPMAHQQQFVG